VDGVEVPPSDTSLMVRLVPDVVYVPDELLVWGASVSWQVHDVVMVPVQVAVVPDPSEENNVPSAAQSVTPGTSLRHEPGIVRVEEPLVVIDELNAPPDVNVTVPVAVTEALEVVSPAHPDAAEPASPTVATHTLSMVHVPTMFPPHGANVAHDWPPPPLLLLELQATPSATAPATATRPNPEAKRRMFMGGSLV
jgi:hypothetical protein